MNDKTLITNIQRFSINDGPGFRTSVFLKGCPLNCIWCHNPETISYHKQLYWKKRLCNQCGYCYNACSKGAIIPVLNESNRKKDVAYQKINRNICDLCMECVKECYYDALEMVGKVMSISEILNIVNSDKHFYENSGGGMTLSGGEPTSHPDFSYELLTKTKEKGIHTCLDTNGFCDYQVIEKLINKVDLVLFDIKHIDPVIHKQITGVSNTLILNNLKRLSNEGIKIWIRIPVIPGYSDTTDTHKLIANFISDLPGKVERVDLLPFHNYCENKYEWLDMEWKMSDIDSLEPFQIKYLIETYTEKKLLANIGGSGFENY